MWVFEYARGKVYDKLYFHSQIESRFGNSAKEAYFFYGQFGLVYQPKEWVNWALYYRQTAIRVGDTDTWRVNYVPMTDLTFSWKKDGWELNDRNRYMFLVRDPLFKPNLSLYRNELKLRSPKIGGTKISSYLSEEIFILQTRGLNQSRTALGITYHCAKEASVDTHFMLRYLKANNDWKPNYVLGINGRISF